MVDFNWDRIYNEKSSNDVSWFEQKPTISYKIVKSLNLSPNSIIADLGCGESFFPSELLEHGFLKIYAVDISQKALDFQKNVLCKNSNCVKFIRHNIKIPNIPFFESIDLWHDRTLLHFLREEHEMSTYISNLKSTLNINGYAILAEHSYSGPEKCSGLELKRYSIEDYVELLGQGFAKLKEIYVDQLTPSGSIRNLLYGVFRRVS